MKNEIIIYQPDDLIKVEVKIDDETVWLNNEQISSLFGRDRSVISRHISNIFKEGELEKNVVCAYFAQTTQHGAIAGKVQKKNIEYFNLDVIISVGYRVKSKQGTQFRIWANKVLKEYLLRGYTVNKRIDRVEDKMDALSNKINEIDLQLNTSLQPKQGVFFDGQVFEAYKLVSDVVRSAKKSIILIDNYVDDTVLTLFSKRKKGVTLKILTKNLDKKKDLDVKKFNEQFPPAEIIKFDSSHDRFMIVDGKDLYHFGASLKDLGKKWFAFSKMDVKIEDMLRKVKEI